MTPDNPYGPFDAGGGDTIKCPFCGEPDFDAIGLKHHFQAGHCDVWNETPPPPRPRRETGESPKAEQQRNSEWDRQREQIAAPGKIPPGPKDPRPVGCTCGDWKNPRCLIHSTSKNR